MGMFHRHGKGPRSPAVRLRQTAGDLGQPPTRGHKLTVHAEQLERGLDLGLEAAPSVQDRTISLFSRGELPHFAGINTFLKAPYARTSATSASTMSPSSACPFDLRHDLPRRARRFGPQGIRRISALYDSYNRGHRRRSVRADEPLRRRRRLHHPGQPREVLRPDRRAACRTSPQAGAFPVMLGGDHSIGYPGRARHRARTSKAASASSTSTATSTCRKGHGRADAHHAVVPRDQHPERARRTWSRSGSAAGRCRARR